MPKATGTIELRGDARIVPVVVTDVEISDCSATTIINAIVETAWAAVEANQIVLCRGFTRGDCEARFDAAPRYDPQRAQWIYFVRIQQRVQTVFDPLRTQSARDRRPAQQILQNGKTRAIALE